ncbi:hypothetical protein TSUD_208620 [Trifolium subterraneum]|uniref:Uncharacterized protein n=1 Tax=Trifolium subterraneum TaxID=3900 RepID=A0A2Z6N606_TRISU|nr:hypothetical protein TSUD_208620 [Trifolium subterraneum]
MKLKIDPAKVLKIKALGFEAVEEGKMSFLAHTDKVIEIVQNFQRTEEQHRGSDQSYGCVSYIKPMSVRWHNEDVNFYSHHL